MTKEQETIIEKLKTETLFDYLVSDGYKTNRIYLKEILIEIMYILETSPNYEKVKNEIIKNLSEIWED